MRHFRRPIFVPAVALFAIAITGCPAVPDLPDSFDIATTATSKTTAPVDSGVASMANSTWTVHRKPDPEVQPAERRADSSGLAAAGKLWQRLVDSTLGAYGPLIAGGILPRPPVDETVVRIDFDATGHLSFVHDSLYFLPEIYGTEIPVGVEWRDSLTSGTSFRSVSFGVEAAGHVGYVVFVQVRLGGLYVGKAMIYTWGTVVGDRIDGQFGYVLDFTGGIVENVLTTGGDQYPIYALRE